MVEALTRITGIKFERHHVVLILLVVMTLVSMVFFMTYGARGSWEFVLSFRGRKLAGLMLVGVAIAVSTVLFQTITNNRILTPSIMGFDAMFRLVQTIIVFGFSSLFLVTLDPRMMFFVNAGLMLTFALILFRWLFGGQTRDLHLLVLAGFIFGAFFRSLTELMQRLIDPNEFVILQDQTFASFSTIDESLLGVAAIVIFASVGFAYAMRAKLDVIGLGRETAINLGVEYKKSVSQVILIVALLVSVSTALVGPVTFFGLLVANLAYTVLGNERHSWTLPAAALLGVLMLVAGQVILERVLGFNSALSIIIEFVGGIVFIVLLLRRAKS